MGCPSAGFIVLTHVDIILQRLTELPRSTMASVIRLVVGGKCQFVHPEISMDGSSVLCVVLDFPVGLPGLLYTMASKPIYHINKSVSEKIIW